MATNGSNGQTVYERRDINSRALAYFGIVILVTVVLALFFAKGVFDFFDRTTPRGPAATPFETGQVRTLPPFPRLQPKPVEDLEQYQYDQQKELQSYGWINKQTGTVHIPIDSAMSLLLKRGLPARATPPPPETPISSGEISSSKFDLAAPASAPGSPGTSRQP